MEKFSFKNCSVTFGGLILSGFADGDNVVEIVPNQEMFALMVGAKGDTTRTQTSDESARITVNLLQTSPSNKDLEAIHFADKETGAGILPLQIVNLDDDATYFCSTAWIIAPPTITLGQNPNAVSWVFEVEKVERVIAGAI